VLLPDARVLVGGHVPLPAFHEHQREGENPQVTDETFEVYEPPYLFLDDTRPVIEAGQAAGTWGQDVTLWVNGLEEGVHSVVLMRPGATTHGYDADQRAIELEVTGENLANGFGSLTVQLPPDANVAPPGHYMVFVNEDIDGEAMPSEASFIELS
ncbi:MAG: galactose oxidase early set domain-containing protein, partial [Candidatus Thermoplasmatota archaeon]|nr:galactose oxidase early set domain-containing protein [Candidatus Thermoplasmatota archaeon]